MGRVLPLAWLLALCLGAAGATLSEEALHDQLSKTTCSPHSDDALHLPAWSRFVSNTPCHHLLEALPAKMDTLLTRTCCDVASAREGNYHEESLNCSLGLPNICTPACAACVMPALVRCLARLPAHPSWKQAQRFGGICLSVKSPAMRELAKAVKQMSSPAVRARIRLKEVRALELPATTGAFREKDLLQLFSQKALAAGYTKRPHTTCPDVVFGASFDSLQAAEDACTSRDDCTGVLDRGCDGAGAFELCRPSLRPESAGPSCLYRVLSREEAEGQAEEDTEEIALSSREAGIPVFASIQPLRASREALYVMVYRDNMEMDTCQVAVLDRRFQLRQVAKHVSLQPCEDPRLVAYSPHGESDGLQDTFLVLDNTMHANPRRGMIIRVTLHSHADTPRNASLDVTIVSHVQLEPWHVTAESSPYETRDKSTKLGKNWMPFVHGDRLFLVSALTPLAELKRAEWERPRPPAAHHARHSTRQPSKRVHEAQRELWRMYEQPAQSTMQPGFLKYGGGDYRGSCNLAPLREPSAAQRLSMQREASVPLDGVQWQPRPWGDLRTSRTPGSCYFGLSHVTVDSNSHFAAAFTLDMSERPPKLQWLFEFDREHVTVVPLAAGSPGATPGIQELVKTRSRLNIMSEGTEDGPSGGVVDSPGVADPTALFWDHAGERLYMAMTLTTGLWRELKSEDVHNVLFELELLLPSGSHAGDGTNRGQASELEAALQWQRTRVDGDDDDTNGVRSTASGAAVLALAATAWLTLLGLLAMRAKLGTMHTFGKLAKRSD